MYDRLRSFWVLSLGCVLASSALAFGADKPAAEIIKEIDSVEVPKLDRSKVRDQSYVKEYIKQRQEAAAKRGQLALELYKADPNHQRVPELMIERWNSTRPADDKFESIFKEIDDVLAHTKNDKFKIDATFVKAQVKLFANGQHPNGKFDMSPIDDFIKLAPKDPRCSQLLYRAVMSVEDSKVKAELEDRVLKEYPDSRFAPMIKGARRQHESVGKPFELEFADATSGSTVSMASLKGKVVVIDFWATWCGPCVAEMPTMKKIYAKYHNQGVEFLGISLDQPKEQGGLDELKKFVKEKEIPWPQYYQGKGWESEFSSSWGINSIPTMFVVDQAGKLVSVEARGKLETLIPELLGKKAEPASGGGQ